MVSRPIQLRAKAKIVSLSSHAHCSDKVNSMTDSTEPQALPMYEYEDAGVEVHQTAIQFCPTENVRSGPSSQPPNSFLSTLNAPDALTSMPAPYMSLHTSTPRVSTSSSYASAPYTSMPRSAPYSHRSTPTYTQAPGDPSTSDTSVPYPDTDPLALFSSTSYADTSTSVPQPSTSYTSLSDTSALHPDPSTSMLYASTSTSDNPAPYYSYEYNDFDRTD
jgi:hypothetical protein